jgi:hypothetical protein
MTIQELINALSQFDPTRDAVVALFKNETILIKFSLNKKKFKVCVDGL